MTSRQEKAVDHLEALGLNRLEARVYLCLLGQPPMTAYRAAQKLGAAAANVYKAVEALAAMGAVLVEGGGNRMCRAVPFEEFLRQLERGFQDKSRRAARALAGFRSREEDEGWYKLESVTQMLQRACDMLEVRAEKIAVIDAFPRILARLLPAVRAALARGVEVIVQAYEPVEIPGASIAIPSMSAGSMALWQSEQLNVVIDGRECLAALVDRNLEHVYQGIWSRSLYLSCVLHAGIRSEHTIHRMRQCIGERGERARIREVLEEHSFFVNSDVPGQRELMERFVRGDQR